MTQATSGSPANAGVHRPDPAPIDHAAASANAMRSPRAACPASAGLGAARARARRGSEPADRRRTRPQRGGGRGALGAGCRRRAPRQHGVVVVASGLDGAEHLVGEPARRDDDGTVLERGRRAGEGWGRSIRGELGTQRLGGGRDGFGRDAWAVEMGEAQPPDGLPVHPHQQVREPGGRHRGTWAPSNAGIGLVSSIERTIVGTSPRRKGSAGVNGSGGGPAGSAGGSSRSVTSRSSADGAFGARAERPRCGHARVRQASGAPRPATRSVSSAPEANRRRHGDAGERVAVVRRGARKAFLTAAPDDHRRFEAVVFTPSMAAVGIGELTDRSLEVVFQRRAAVRDPRGRACRG